MIYFQLDDVEEGKVPNTQDSLNDLDVMMLGGVVLDKIPSYIETDTFVNFSGCLSGTNYLNITT